MQKGLICIVKTLTNFVLMHKYAAERVHKNYKTLISYIYTFLPGSMPSMMIIVVMVHKCTFRHN